MAIPNWRTIIGTLNSKTSEEEYHQLSKNFENSDTDEKIKLLHQFATEKQVLPEYRIEAEKSALASKRHRELGNRAFANSRDVDALTLYTESLAYAPSDSEELALAYANRSAVLFSLGKFTSALVDVNRALKNESYPEALRPKLWTRKEKCIAKIESVDEEKTYAAAVATPVDERSGSFLIHGYSDISDVNLSWKRRTPQIDLKNENLPNASAKLKLAKNDWAGRHIVVDEDVNPGELLMMEKPYTAVLFSENYRTHCYNCFVECPSMIPCQSCSLVMFCGENCRGLATIQYHEVECRMLHSLLSFDERKLELIAVRILLQASRQGRDLEQLTKHPIFKDPFCKIGEFDLEQRYESVNDYLRIHLLEDNLDRVPLTRKLERTFMAVALLHLLKRFNYFSRASVFTPESEGSESGLTSNELFTGVFLLKAILTAETNGHYLSGRSSKMDHRLGAAIYPSVSYVNHSCDANVLQITYGNQMGLYATQPILAGEQVSLEYGPSYLTMGREERRAYLQNEYYFVCQCDPCRYDWPRLHELPSENPIFVSDKVDSNRQANLSNRFQELISSSPAVSVLEKELEFLVEYMIFLRRHIKKPWMDYVHCQELVQCILTKVPPTTCDLEI